MSWRESCVMPYHYSSGYSSGLGGTSYYRPSPPPSYYVPVYARPSSSDDTTAKQLMDCVYTTKTNFRPLPGYENTSQGYDRVSVGVDCDEVYPNLFIGDAGCARNKAYLRLLGITHVVNTAEGHRFGMVNTDAHFYRDTGIRYLGLPLLDHPCANIREYFHQSAEFIDDAIKSGGKVLVHCLMGMSRSSTIALAYLMMKVGLPAPMALRMCRQNRDIRPNDGFLRQLAELDNKLKRDRERLNRTPHSTLGLTSRSYRL